MSHDAPTICITYPYPIGQRAAGGSRTTREVAFHLARQGAKVVVMPVSTNALSRTFPRKKIAEHYLGLEQDAEFAAEGVELIRPPQNPFLYQLDGLPVKRAVARLLRDRPVDLVLGHYHEAAFLPGLLQPRGILFGFLATWQTYAGLDWEPVRWQGKLRKWLDHKTVVEAHRRADVLLAISDFTRRELIDIVGCRDEQIALCPLGVEPSFLEIERGPAPAKIENLLFFGRITPSKGFFDALEALGMLAARGIRDWRYRIVGEGRAEWAREAAQKHGIADRVEILDPVGTEGLRAHLAWAQLAVLPSHAESFGHAIVEAQASGVPVVSYAVGSIPEVAPPGVGGWLVPFQRIDELALAIEQALADPAATHALGLRARERVAATYRWEHTAGIILEQYRRRRRG